MSSIINSSTSPAGLIQSSDGTATLKIQTGGLDAVFIDASQNTIVNNNLTVSGTTTIYGSNVLVSSAIGSTVQAYDANTAAYDDATANFTGTLQNAGSNVLVDTDIGGSVQAYDVDTAKLDVAQSFTAQQTFSELKETVHTLATSGTVILDPANGSIQTTSLSNNITFTDSLETGQSIVLHIDAGSSYLVTFPTTTWVTSAGNTAPTLTANDTVVFWKISSTLYGAYVGSYA